MSELVALGRFLGSAMQSPEAFDFSLAYAIVDWIRKPLSNASVVPDSISDVVKGVNLLENTICLTSGSGLVEIWRALSSGCSPDVDGTMIAHLENADRRLRQCSGDMSAYCESCGQDICLPASLQDCECRYLS